MFSKKSGSDSDSSSDDDENLAHLREAADTHFINDGMFQMSGKKTDPTTPKPVTAPPKSQRHIADENEHIDDLLIPEEVQKFVSKKLAKIIENGLEFVDVHVNEDDDGADNIEAAEEIKLLDDVVLNINWTNSGAFEGRIIKKPEIKRRKLCDHDDNDAKSDSVRISEAVIDLEDVSKEVQNWKPRSKGTVYEYVDKNGRLFEVEQKTEFSALRKKNNWDESKISKKLNRNKS